MSEIITEMSEADDSLIAAIAEAGATALRELAAVARLRAGDIVVVGCSSSEMIGAHIGKNSNPEVATALYMALSDVAAEGGFYLAAQCCEHLNRALVLERACAERYGLSPVWVRPRPKAGGSFATAAWEHMQSPVAVETVVAHAGLDIGSTLIGMHLRRVAVPVRLSMDHIGYAPLTAARTRPPYIGGPRADYDTAEP